MFEGIFRRRRLPHWDVPDATFFITSCLAGSIPARGLLDLSNYRADLDARPRPLGQTEEAWELRKHKLVFALFDQLLDNEPAAVHLKGPDVATIVRSSFYHFANQRYDLLAYVIMPSHFHWVIRPRRDWCDQLEKVPGSARTPRERIMHSLKSYTANQCNQILKQVGAFWQDESYDHIVRDDDELMRIIDYVERNPVNARLTEKPDEWAWSSATDRRRWNLRAGEPLVPSLSAQEVVRTTV